MLQTEPPLRASSVTAFERMYGAVTPYAFGAVWLASRAMGLPEPELMARVGELPEVSGPLLWLHGASAGEMSAAIKLVGLLRDAGLRFTAGFTSTNRAGVEYVSRSATAQALAALVPWDVPRWLGRAFSRWHPCALILVETELWPGLIFEAARRDVPVFLVSARIYPRDIPRYRAIRRLIAPTLGRLTAVLAQNETERARLVELGASPERTMVAGNLKYADLRPKKNEDTLVARARLGIEDGEPVAAFGSIHSDEMDFILPAVKRLVALKIRVVVAPRHLGSADFMMRRLESVSSGVWRRSAGPGDGRWQVLVLDTMGELSSAYNAAVVAVVGGGFRNHGGHNLLEPLLGEAAVIFGSHCDHFEYESLALATATPQARVTSAKELVQSLEEWLTGGVTCGQILNLQRQALPDGNAIRRRYLDALMPWLQEKHF